MQRQSPGKRQDPGDTERFMYPIGKFSRMCGLSVKTLRSYHESGLLVPDHVDDETGYRYYRPSAVERARVIVALREMDFTLADVASILRDCEEDADMVDFLKRQKEATDAKLRETRRIQNSLNQILTNIERVTRRNLEERVVEKTLPDTLFCSIRTTGAWSEVGSLFGQVARRAGRHMRGPGVSLCYDGEYKEEADYEIGFEVRREIRAKGDVACRVLSGGPCLSAVHRGGYDSISRTYEKLFSALERAGAALLLPTREVYWKGPGMIFRGNPEKYITEIQVLLKS